MVRTITVPVTETITETVEDTEYRVTYVREPRATVVNLGHPASLTNQDRPEISSLKTRAISAQIEAENRGATVVSDVGLSINVTRSHPSDVSLENTDPVVSLHPLSGGTSG